MHSVTKFSESAHIIHQIKASARIDQIWTALGGGPLRGGRGKAFWRGGDSYSIALNTAKGLWCDFVTNTGGDIFALVQLVRGCGFRDALHWLADHTGVTVSAGAARAQTPDTDWPADLQRATWWRMTAGILAEWALEELPHCHPDRRALTILLQTIRSGDGSLVREFREWRRTQPAFVAAMVYAGRLHDARMQRKAARWLVNYCG